MPLVRESERERRAFLAEHKRMGDVYAKLRGALITCTLTIIPLAQGYACYLVNFHLIMMQRCCVCHL